MWRPVFAARPNPRRFGSFPKAALSVQLLTALLSFGAKKLPACQLPAQLWGQSYLLAVPNPLRIVYRGQGKSSGTNGHRAAWLTCTRGAWFQNNSRREGRRWKEDGAINQSFGFPSRAWLCVSILNLSFLPYSCGLILLVLPIDAYYVLSTSLRIFHVLSHLIP